MIKILLSTLFILASFQSYAEEKANYGQLFANSVGLQQIATRHILILTLSNAGTSYSGKALHSIEFESVIACTTAGEAWKNSLRDRENELASYVCVKHD